MRTVLRGSWFWIDGVLRALLATEGGHFGSNRLKMRPGGVPFTDKNSIGPRLDDNGLNYRSFFKSTGTDSAAMKMAPKTIRGLSSSPRRADQYFASAVSPSALQLEFCRREQAMAIP